jgi:hypothetical protein
MKEGEADRIEKCEEIVWPYGPPDYLNLPLGEINSKFLKWIAENCFNDELAVAADLIWDYREKHGTHFYEN